MDTLAVGIGSSQATDAAGAGAAAARAAVAQLQDVAPALVLVFASMKYDLAEMLRAVGTVTGRATLAGASTCGQFHDGELVPPGSGVTVLALAGGPYRFGVASVRGVRTDALEAGRRLTRAARDAVGAPLREHGAILLLTMGVDGDLESLLRGVYRVTGAGVPVVGGAAANDRLLSETVVLHDDELITDGAVAVWIDSPRPLSVVARHGWHSISAPMVVTRTEGVVVHELGGRPAAEVFTSFVHHDMVASDADLRWAVGAKPAVQDVHGAQTAQGGPWLASHAFGLIDPDGGHLIRGCFLDDEGRLRTFAPLPQYGAVEVVSSMPEDLLAVSEEVVGEALREVDAQVLLAFSCVARLDILGERTGEEVARLQAAAGGVRTCGFYTYGEFARSVGLGGFHNATVAAVAL